MMVNSAKAPWMAIAERSVAEKSVENIFESVIDVVEGV